jgi:hypothetical protein
MFNASDEIIKVERAKIDLNMKMDLLVKIIEANESIDQINSIKNLYYQKISNEAERSKDLGKVLNSRTHLIKLYETY